MLFVRCFVLAFPRLLSSRWISIFKSRDFLKKIIWTKLLGLTIILQRVVHRCENLMALSSGYMHGVWVPPIAWNPVRKLTASIYVLLNSASKELRLYMARITTNTDRECGGVDRSIPCSRSDPLVDSLKNVKNHLPLNPGISSPPKPLLVSQETISS